MHGAGERYVTPFVIMGGGSLLAIAAITALPALAGAIVQRLSAELADATGKRKRIFVAAGLSQVFLWSVFCVAIYLPALVDYWVMLCAFILFIAGHSFSQPPWMSTMGDLVPATRRGRYFGYRNFLGGVVMMAAYLTAGEWLSWCEAHLPGSVLGLSGRNFGFLVLFAFAGLARLASVYYLGRMHDPAYHAPPEERFTLRQFIRRIPQGYYGKFVVYRAWNNAGYVMLTTYFGWYLLDQLGCSPAAFAWITGVGLMANFTAQTVCGRYADRIGNKQVLAIGAQAAVLTPLLLMVSNNLWWLGVVQVYDGVAYAAISIAGANYMLDIVTPPKRARCSAYAMLFNSTGTAVGAFGGALVLLGVTHLLPTPWTLGPIRVGEAFTVLLAVNAVLRLVPNLLLLRTFQDVPVQRRATAPQTSRL